MEKKIYVTDFDMKRLMTLIERDLPAGGKNQKHLQELKQELANAQIVAPRDVPQDVITMNSIVRLRDLDTEEIKTYKLVFPANADVATNKISILAPIGTAIIGYKQGDVVEWNVPAGKVRLRVEQIIYQPESSGDYKV